MFQENDEKNPEMNDPEQMIKCEAKDTDIDGREQEDNLEDDDIRLLNSVPRCIVTDL